MKLLPVWLTDARNPDTSGITADLLPDPEEEVEGGTLSGLIKSTTFCALKVEF